MSDIRNRAATSLARFPDGSELIMEEMTAHKNDYVGVGKELANRVVAKGAKALLERAEKIALSEIF